MVQNYGIPFLSTFMTLTHFLHSRSMLKNISLNSTLTPLPFKTTAITGSIITSLEEETIATETTTKDRIKIPVVIIDHDLIITL